MVLSLVPLVHIVPLDVAAVGVPHKVPRGHAQPIFTKVASLKCRAGRGAPVHVTYQIGDVNLLVGEVHPC